MQTKIQIPQTIDLTFFIWQLLYIFLHVVQMQTKFPKVKLKTVDISSLKSI